MTNTSTDLYSLCWSNHTKNLKSAFDVFRDDNELVDVTLSCDGRKLKAHKIVLSACSVYFLDLFRDNPCQHPIIILRDVRYQIMVDILNFMYQGEVNVDINHLDSFLKTAQLLQVKGLVDVNRKPRNLYENQSKNNKQIERTLTNIQRDSTSGFDDVPLQSINTHLHEHDDSMEIGSESQLKHETDSDETMSENNSAEFVDLNLENAINIIHQGISSDENLHDSFRPNAGNKEHVFPCQYCDKTFSHPNSLRLHLPQHSGRTSCGLCQAVLSRKYELKVHMRKKHNIDLN